MREHENSELKSKAMRGRPRKFDEADVTARLMNLFWDKGYEATSLSDIVTVTGLKKGSLYKVFGGKRDMYLKALAFYNAQYVKAACAQLIDKSAGPPRARLETFLSSPIDAAVGQGDQRGCFLCNAAAETNKQETDIKGSIAAAHERLLRALETVLHEDAPNQTGEDIQIRARALLVTYTGMRILVRASPDMQMLKDAKKAALEF